MDKKQMAELVRRSRPHWPRRLWRWFFPFRINIMTGFPPDGKWRHVVVSVNTSGPESTVEAWINGEQMDNLAVLTERHGRTMNVHLEDVAFEGDEQYEQG